MSVPGPSLLPLPFIGATLVDLHSLTNSRPLHRHTVRSTPASAAPTSRPSAATCSVLPLSRGFDDGDGGQSLVPSHSSASPENELPLSGGAVCGKSLSMFQSSNSPDNELSLSGGGGISGMLGSMLGSNNISGETSGACIVAASATAAAIRAVARSR